LDDKGLNEAPKEYLHTVELCLRTHGKLFPKTMGKFALDSRLEWISVAYHLVRVLNRTKYFIFLIKTCKQRVQVRTFDSTANHDP